MRKLFLLLVFTSSKGIVLSQTGNNVTDVIGNSFNDSKNLFWLRNSFTIQLSRGNKIIIEVPDKQGFQQIINLDSIIQMCYQKLLPLKDSFNNELNSRRLDVTFSKVDNFIIHYKEIIPKAKSFAYKNNELYALKVQQDTLCITGFYESNKNPLWSKTSLRFNMPTRITVVLNNIQELLDYTDGSLNQYTQKIYRDWQLYTATNKKEKWNDKLKGVYYTVDSLKDFKVSNIAKKVKKQLEVQPHLGVILQNYQQNFVPSFIVGARLNGERKNILANQIALFGEMVFNFQRNSVGENKTYINKFITAQYAFFEQDNGVNTNTTVGVKYQYSLSYLIGREGEMFEKNTFKLLLPGVHYYSVSLTPGMYFNNFFNKVTPTLNLSIILD
jgi:hypothetical protein